MMSVSYMDEALRIVIAGRAIAKGDREIVAAIHQFTFNDGSPDHGAARRSGDDEGAVTALRAISVMTTRH
jgi:hypothetical protein